MPGLSVSDLVNVGVILSPLAPPTQNFGALMLLGASAVIDVSQRYRSYSSLTQVANDFGTSAPEYLAADFFYSQSPQPTTLLIGRWAQTATSGLLHGGILSAAQQVLANFTSVTNGGVDFTIDGSAVNLTALNFSAATNLNGVASIISTALGSHGSCTWNSVYSRFEFVSASSGTSSSVSFGSTGAGTDISTLIGSTAASGATAVAGIAAESMLSAVQTLTNMSNAWYGLAIAVASPSDNDIIAVAGYVEGCNPHRFFVPTTQETAALSATSTTDLAAQLQALGYNHTAVQYSSFSPYAGVSLFARQATVNYQGNNTVINLMYMQEPGVVAETLTESQAAALKAKNCNVFVNYNNSTAIIQWGTCASGQWIDVIIGCDYLSNAIQTAIYSLLYTSQGKVPQTDAGVNMIVTTAENILVGAVADGLLAPGVWNGPAIGPIASGQTLQKGYFVYAPPVASQSQSARSARQSPVLQVLVKMAGAIDTVSALINVSQ
jgi:Protein of unknown function (DUF3383)